MFAPLPAGIFISVLTPLLTWLYGQRGGLCFHYSSSQVSFWRILGLILNLTNLRARGMIGKDTMLVSLLLVLRPAILSSLEIPSVERMQQIGLEL